MSYLDPEPEEPLVRIDWHVPWHAQVPGAVLAVAMTAAWLLHFPRGMGAWGISGAALAEGRYETIALHMFAHGPLFHIVMNMMALVALGPPLVARLGTPPGAWLRFLAFFVASALAGTALYLALHPHGDVPMLGASGALYGLLGLLLRLPPEPGPLLSLRTPEMRKVAIELLKSNAWLFVMLALLALSSGGRGGLAWEAHLGGFLLGLLAGPNFLPRWDDAAEDAADAAPEPAIASD